MSAPALRRPRAHAAIARHIVAALLIAIVAPLGAQAALAQGTATPVATSVPASCPVTIPNGDVPPFGNLGFFPGPVFHGENGIWTSFGPDGTVAWQPAMGNGPGDYGVKFLWFHDERARGHLRIAGTYLGGSAPPLVAQVPDGYGEVGYQASGLIFSRLGCWQITASASGSSMTFTIWLYQGEPLSIRSTWTSPTPPSYCHVTRQPSAGVNPDALRAAPAGTVSVGDNQLAAFLAPGGAYEVAYRPGATPYPWQGFSLHWWQNQSNDLLPLIGGERTAGYGGPGNIDYDIGVTAPIGAVTTPLSVSNPGCWKIELRAGQSSVTFTVWLWTRELPPLATPVATPQA